MTDKVGVYLIFDHHWSIKSIIDNEHIGWNRPNVYHVYCIRHIASNFNHRFKNKKQKQMRVKLGKIILLIMLCFLKYICSLGLNDIHIL